MLQTIAIRVAQALIDWALARVFGAAAKAVFLQVDRRLTGTLLRHDPAETGAVITGSIELVTGRPATDLEKALVALAYNPIAAATSPFAKL